MRTMATASPFCTAGGALTYRKGIRKEGCFYDPTALRHVVVIAFQVCSCVIASARGLALPRCVVSTRLLHPIRPVSLCPPGSSTIDDIVPVFAQSLIIKERSVEGMNISGFTSRDALPVGTCGFSVVSPDHHLSQTFAVAAAASKSVDEEQCNDVSRQQHPSGPAEEACCSLESSPSLLMSAATLPNSCLVSGSNAMPAGALGAPPCGVKVSSTGHVGLQNCQNSRCCLKRTLTEFPLCTSSSVDLGGSPGLFPLAGRVRQAR